MFDFSLLRQEGHTTACPGLDSFYIHMPLRVVSEVTCPGPFAAAAIYCPGQVGKWVGFQPSVFDCGQKLVIRNSLSSTKQLCIVPTIANARATGSMTMVRKMIPHMSVRWQGPCGIITGHSTSTFGNIIVLLRTASGVKTTQKKYGADSEGVVKKHMVSKHNFMSDLQCIHCPYSAASKKRLEDHIYGIIQTNQSKFSTVISVERATEITVVYISM